MRQVAVESAPTFRKVRTHMLPFPLLSYSTMETSTSKQLALLGQKDKSTARNLTAGLLSDRVSAPFAGMGWVEEYTSMQKNQVLPQAPRNDPSEDGNGNSQSESRSDEEQKVDEAIEGSKGEKNGSFAIQIQNNDPIFFDDDSVSTLTHWDRARAQRKESITELNDMLGYFDHNKKGQTCVEETKSAEPYHPAEDNKPSSNVVDKPNILQPARSLTHSKTLSTETDLACENKSTTRRRQKMDRVKKRLSGRMRGAETASRPPSSTESPISPSSREGTAAIKENDDHKPPEDNVNDLTFQLKAEKEGTVVVEVATAVEVKATVEEIPIENSEEDTEEAAEAEGAEEIKEENSEKAEPPSESIIPAGVVSALSTPENPTDAGEPVLPDNRSDGETYIVLAKSVQKPSHRRWTSDEDGKTVSFKGDDEPETAMYQATLVEEEEETDLDDSCESTSSHDETNNEEENSACDSASEGSIRERKKSLRYKKHRLASQKKRMPRYKEKGTKKKVLKGILKTPYRKPRKFTGFDHNSEVQDRGETPLDMWFDFSIVMYAFDWFGRDRPFEAVG